VRELDDCQAGLFAARDGGDTWQPLNQGGNIESAWFFVGETVAGIDIDPRNPCNFSITP
jgi:hypothetical protein